jgi:hypothetical protein
MAEEAEAKIKSLLKINLRKKRQGYVPEDVLERLARGDLALEEFEGKTQTNMRRVLIRILYAQSTGAEFLRDTPVKNIILAQGLYTKHNRGIQRDATKAMMLDSIQMLARDILEQREIEGERPVTPPVVPEGPVSFVPTEVPEPPPAKVEPAPAPEVVEVEPKSTPEPATEPAVEKLEPEPKTEPVEPAPETKPVETPERPVVETPPEKEAEEPTLPIEPPGEVVESPPVVPEDARPKISAPTRSYPEQLAASALDAMFQTISLTEHSPTDIRNGVLGVFAWAEESHPEYAMEIKAAFLRWFLYTGEVPETADSVEARVAAFAVVSEATHSVLDRAVSSYGDVAVADPQNSVQPTLQDEHHELKETLTDDTVSDAAERLDRGMRELLKRLGLKRGLGVDFLINGVQSSSAVEQLLELGGLAYGRYATGEISVEELNAELNDLMVDYFYGDGRGQVTEPKTQSELFMIREILQNSTLGAAFGFHDMVDLYNRFKTLKASAVAKGVRNLVAEEDLTTPLRTLSQYQGAVRARMATSVLSAVNQALATENEARLFLELVRELSSLEQDAQGNALRYAFFGSIFNLPADVLATADDANRPVSKKGKRLTPPLLFQLQNFVSDSATNTTWDTIAAETLAWFTSKKREGASWASHRAEVKEALLTGSGMLGYTRAAGNMKGWALLDGLVRALPLTENPTRFRRADGTQKTNLRMPSMFSDVLARLHEEAKQADPATKEWMQYSLDMFEVRDATVKPTVQVKVIEPRDALEQDFHDQLLSIWKANRNKGKGTHYPSWFGTFGEKESLEMVWMPMRHSIESAKEYYTEQFSNLSKAARGMLGTYEGKLISADILEQIVREGVAEAAPDLVRRAEKGSKSAQREVERRVIFGINDTANRVRVQTAIHGDISKFGAWAQLSKRNAMVLSMGIPLNPFLFGKNELNAITVNDPEFLLEHHRAKAVDIEMKLNQAQERLKANPADPKLQHVVEQLKLEADKTLEELRASTDGFALIPGYAMEAMQFAFGPALTQTDHYGPLQVMKALAAGQVQEEDGTYSSRFNKMGLGVLNDALAEHNPNGAYKLLWEAVKAHNKGRPRSEWIDVVYFGETDKAKSKQTMSFFQPGAETKGMAVRVSENYENYQSDDFSFDVVHTTPVTDFRWLLSAQHGTQADTRQLATQLIAVLSPLPGAYSDLNQVQNEHMDWFERNQLDRKLDPTRVLRPDQSAYSELVREGALDPNSLLVRSEVMHQQALTLGRNLTASGVVNQLVEQPTGDPYAVPYYELRTKDSEGNWAPTDRAQGARVRLAKFDGNMDGVRADMVMDWEEDGFSFRATTFEEAHDILKQKEIFPYFIDLFEIPREILDDRDKVDALTKSQEQIDKLEFREWELDIKDGHVVLPGGLGLVQRVPSDAIYSVSLARLGRRIRSTDGKSGANVIQTAPEIQDAAGADFDIDKRFVMSLYRGRISQEKWDKTPKGHRALLRRTFDISDKAKESDKDGKPYGKVILSGQWYAYNKFILNLSADYTDSANHELITMSMDHGLLQNLIDVATARQENVLENKEASYGMTPRGAIAGYKANAVGRQGLGRTANSLYIANVMQAEGYGFAKDLSFSFRTHVPGLGSNRIDIRLNRKVGDRGNLLSARTLLGLVLNKFADHGKLQQIDKIGGTEVTASLFAYLLYGYADMADDFKKHADGVEHMETIYQFLMSPEIQAWVDVELSANAMKQTRKMNPEAKKEAWKKRSREIAKERGILKFKPDLKVWDTVVAGVNEMFQLERSVRGWYHTLPSTQEELDSKVDAYNEVLNGYRVVADKEGRPRKVYNQFRRPGMPAIQDAFETVPEADIPAFLRPTNKAYKMLQSKVFDESLFNRPGYEALRTAIFETYNSKRYRDEQKEATGRTPAFAARSADNLRRLYLEIQRVMIAKTLMESERIGDNRYAEQYLDMADFQEDLYQRLLQAREQLPENAFLGEALFLNRNERTVTEVVDGQKQVKTVYDYEIKGATGYAGSTLSPVLTQKFHQGFAALDARLQQDLYLNALLTLGGERHSAYGSYAPYIDPAYIVGWAPAIDRVERQATADTRQEPELFARNSGGANSLPLWLGKDLHYTLGTDTRYQLDFNRMRSWDVNATVSHDGRLSDRVRADIESRIMGGSTQALTAQTRRLLDESAKLTLAQLNLFYFKDGDIEPRRGLRNDGSYRFGLDTPDAHGMTSKDWSAYSEYKDKPLSARSAVNRALFELVATPAEPGQLDASKYYTYLQDDYWFLQPDEFDQKFAPLTKAQRQLLKDLNQAQRFTEILELPIPAEEAREMLREATKKHKKLKPVLDRLNDFLDYRDRIDEIKGLVARGRIAERERVEVVQDAADLATLENLQELKDLFDRAAGAQGRGLEITDEEQDFGETLSAMLVETVEATAKDFAPTRRAQKALIDKTRGADIIKENLRFDLRALRLDVGARTGGSERVLYLSDNIGEQLLQVLTVLQENGIFTWDQLDEMATELYIYDEDAVVELPDEYASQRTVDMLFKDGTLSSADKAELEREYIDKKRPLPKFWVRAEGRKMVRSVIAEYEAERARHNRKYKTPRPRTIEDARAAKYARISWQEALAQYRELSEKARVAQNRLVGYEFIPYNDRHVFHAPKQNKRGKRMAVTDIANRSVGYRREEAPTFLAITHKHGTVPQSWDITDLLSEWGRGSIESSRVRAVLSELAKYTDHQGVPGIVVGSTGYLGDAHEILVFGDDVKFRMLETLHARLREAKVKNLPPINRSQSPDGQIDALMKQFEPTWSGMGYEKMNFPALGNEFQNIWVQRGTVAQTVRHLTDLGFVHKYRELKWAQNPAKKAALGLARMMLGLNKFMKSLQVGFSFFHHVALLESQIANEGVMGKSLFAPVHYLFALPKGIKLMRDLATDPELTAKWAGYGIKASALPLDAAYMGNGIEQALRKAAAWGRSFSRTDGRWTKVGKAAALASGEVTMTLVNAYTHLNNFLWHGMLPAMKVTMAERMYEQFRADPSLAHLTEEQIANDIAQYVNDALGGQEWEQYMFATPFAQDVLNTLFFAPDWTLSALNVSGLTKVMGHVFGLEGRMNYTDEANSFTRSPLMQQRVVKYLPGFIWHAMLMPTFAMQALSYLFFGDDDQDDKMFFWQNEQPPLSVSYWDRANPLYWANRGFDYLRPDITPLVRWYRKLWGITEPLERRVTLRPGKQLLEIVHWMGHPVNTAWGKSGSGLKATWTMGTGLISAPGTPDELEWKSRNRYVDTGLMFMPFNVQAWAKDIMDSDQASKPGLMTFNSDIPLVFRTAYPAALGSSKYKLTVEMSETFLQAAFFKGAFSNPKNHRRELMARMNYFRREAYRQGVDFADLVTEARRAVKTELNRKYYKIVSKREKSEKDLLELGEIVAGHLLVSPTDKDGLDKLEIFLNKKIKNKDISERTRAILYHFVDSGLLESVEDRARDIQEGMWDDVRLDTPEKSEDDIELPVYPRR